MNETINNTEMLFNGSIWCNLDVALRNMDQVFRQLIQPEDVTVIEWYILRALYNEDGQHASALARGVGRAATSFTPNLDKLQRKGYVERRPDESDRRAVRIYLTPRGQAYRDAVLNSAREIDTAMMHAFDGNIFDAFLDVLVQLQHFTADINVPESI